MSDWIRQAKQALLPGLNTGSQKYKDLTMDLKGKVVVFTGTLSLMTRNEARAIAVKLGAILSDTVSGKTDYLIVGDKPGSKVMAAKRLGWVQTIEEKDWYKLCDPREILSGNKELISRVSDKIKSDSFVSPERKRVPFREVSAPELDLD